MLSGIQRTILKPIKIQGIGLHCGSETTLILKPSPPNTGITFIRTDIKDRKKNSIQAKFKNVTSAKLCTKIENSFGISVSTIEHPDTKTAKQIKIIKFFNILDKKVFYQKN